MKQRATKRAEQSAPPEYGVQLEVVGRALIQQAEARIEWHERTAAIMANELQTLTPESGDPTRTVEFGKRWRRTDLESRMNGHLEYARFLKFVRDSLVDNRRYRLGLADMSVLEIAPRRI